MLSRLMNGMAFVLLAMLIGACSGNGGKSLNFFWQHPQDESDAFSLTGSDAILPTIAIDGQGNTIVVWTQTGSNGYEQVFMAQKKNGTWTYPSGLSDHISPSGQHCFSAKVVMNDAGDALVVWEQIHSGQYQIFVSRYRNGTWTHPQSTGDHISVYGKAANEAQVALSEGGDAVVAWSQNNNSNEKKIFISHLRNGNWQHPQDLNDFVNKGANAQEPTVAINQAGEAIVAWQQQYNSKYRVYLTEYRSGTWTHTVEPIDETAYISPGDTQVHYDLNRPQAVAMDNEGNAIIVWSQDDNSALEQVFKSEYRNGSWTHPSNTADYFSNNQQTTLTLYPDVSMNNDDKAIIVWTAKSSANADRVYYAEYKNNAWSSTSDHTQYISPEGFSASDAKVIMNDRGEAVITWYQRPSLSIISKIYMSEYRNGSWTHPADIDDAISFTSSGLAAFVDVAMNANGQTALTWYQGISGENKIFVSEYSN